MKRFIFSALVLATALAFQAPAEAQSRRKTALPKVDLALGPMRTGTNSVLVEVRNLGFMNSPDTRVLLTITNPQTSRQIYSRSIRVRSLGSNQNKFIDFLNLPSFRNGVVRAMVDPNNQVAEPNERNNVQALLITNSFGPDISAGKIYFHSDRQLSVTIRNNGPQNLPGQIDVTLTTQFGQLNGQRIRQNIPRLDAGKYRAMLFTLQSPLKPGTRVVIQADSGLKIAEQNEGNNQAVKVYYPSKRR